MSEFRNGSKRYLNNAGFRNSGDKTPAAGVSVPRVLVEDRDLTIHVGDVRGVLATLPDESIDCVVTSPPYWGLRDYGVEGQIGLEATPDEYLATMVAVFREVRRVLRREGTCWVNLGDSYHGGGGGNYGSGISTSSGHGQHLTNVRNRLDLSDVGLKPKDLVGIPWRVAFALQQDGWYLRSDIIWSKPNPMPESVTDRPTKAHEYVFLLSKGPRYFFDQEAVREPMQPGSVERYSYAFGGAKDKALTAAEASGAGTRTHPIGEREPTSGRNVRSVWQIATQPYAEAHFATFPEELPRRCILAGCPEWVCAAIVCRSCDAAHPAATVESLWDVEAGLDEIRTRQVPESDALQAELRRVRDVLREQESVRLLAEMSRKACDGDAEHEDEGRPDQPSRLRASVDAGLPMGDDGEGLRAGTPIRDGAASRTEARSVGEGASQERDQGRQPSREPRDRDALSASGRDRVPGLRDALLRSLTCPSCGSTGFRTCGKARERIVVATGPDGRSAVMRNGKAYDDDGRPLMGDNLIDPGVRGSFNSGSATLDRKTLGWSDCGHDNYRPGVVLDPFGGSGTTGLVARNLGRRAILIELSEEYAHLAATRCQQLSLLAEAAT